MSYSATGTARSALSFVLPRYNCGSFGEHFLVKKFMKEFYNLRTHLLDTMLHGMSELCLIIFVVFRTISIYH